MSTSESTIQKRWYAIRTYSGHEARVKQLLESEVVNWSYGDPVTRLRIPILVGDDCIHGHSFFEGATIFPTQLGMAATWDPDLLERAARATAGAGPPPRSPTGCRPPCGNHNPRR